MLFINKLILLKLDEVNQKIERSSFAECKYDPTKKFILNSGPRNGFVQKKFQLNGEIILSVIMLQLGRTSQMRTSHKTYKTGMTVRLLTSGWNTATENLSRFIEIISSNN